jgi:hypothetical protein
MLRMLFAGARSREEFLRMLRDFASMLERGDDSVLEAMAKVFREGLAGKGFVKIMGREVFVYDSAREVCRYYGVGGAEMGAVRG